MFRPAHMGELDIVAQYSPGKQAEDILVLHLADQFSSAYRCLSLIAFLDRRANKDENKLPMYK